MAAITRRTFANLRDEALKRVGRSDSTASSRMEHWITAAYFRLALTFHHYELDGSVAGQAVASGATSTPLPVDTYVVVAVRLLDNAGNYLQRLVAERHSHLFGRAGAATDRPDRYTRWASTLLFEGPTDADYEVDIDYYKVPATPDFASGSPVTHWLWDEAILELAASMALGSYWAQEQVPPHASSLKSFLESVAQPPLKTGVLQDVQGVSTTDRPHGGAQG